MSARSALPMLAIITLATVATSEPAYSGAWGLSPGEYYTEFRSGVFTADSYHYTDGRRDPFLDEGLIQERSLLSLNELGWRKGMSLILGIPAKSLTRRDAEGARTRTETGFSDALVGVRWNIANGSRAVALELDWKAPLGYNRRFLLTSQDRARVRSISPNDDSLNYQRQMVPRLGEGQQDVTLSLHLGSSWPALRAFLEGSGGYRYRFEHPADEIAATASLGFWVGSRLMVAGRYEGEIPIGEGDARPVTGQPGVTAASAADEYEVHMVGPRVVYRVDDRMDVVAGSMHTASAKNGLHVDQIYLALAVRQTKLNRLQGFLGAGQAP